MATYTTGDLYKVEALPYYATAEDTNAAGLKNGKVYLWDAELVNNRIRICTAKTKIGVSEAWLGWVDIGELFSFSQPAPTTADAPTDDMYTYIVKTGDSLWSIAEHIYGDRDYMNKLVKDNNLRNPVLFTGQVLKIEKSEK